MKVECWWFLHDVEGPVQASQVKPVILGPAELGIPPEWTQKAAFSQHKQKPVSASHSLCGNRVEGSCKLAGEAKAWKRKAKQLSPQPGAVFAERSGWHSKHLCIPWQSQKAEGRSRSLQHDTLFSCCQNRATSWSTSLHGGRMIMALQGFSCTHEPWISWLVMSTSQMCIRDHMPGLGFLHCSNKH